MYLNGEGSYRFNWDGGVEATQFLNPNGDRVVVMSSTVGHDLKLEITFKSGGTWVGRLPKKSVTTWVIPSSAFPAESSESNNVPVFV